MPKFRKKLLFGNGNIRQYRKGVFHELARQNGIEIVSEHMGLDHVQSIHPKYAVSEEIGYLKSKCAIAVVM